MINKIIISLSLVLFTTSAFPYGCDYPAVCAVYQNHTQSTLQLNVTGEKDVSNQLCGFGADTNSYTVNTTANLQPGERSSCYCIASDTGSGTIKTYINSEKNELMTLEHKSGYSNHSTPGNDGGIVNGYYVLSRVNKVCNADKTFQFNICDNTSGATKKPCTDPF